MGRIRVLDTPEKKQKAANKKVHKSKSWATLNTNAKFDVIGDDLIARGIIKA